MDATVLIEGETGTGKELVARAIHRARPSQGPPVRRCKLCRADRVLSGRSTLRASAGAFTGAVADHQGLFEAANGGTLFLDEIGDIPLPVQTSLLRVLQEKEITPVRWNPGHAKSMCVCWRPPTLSQRTPREAGGLLGWAVSKTAIIG